MARRINAPGIEVNEIDRSSYDETVDNSTIGTTTLVLGFADKGEDYTVRWVNTMNTFIKTYGNPTNDAERYFYNSVYEILDGGGVCYAAKLPYYNDSLDNFTYTSYIIDSKATQISSPLEIIDSIKKDGFGFCLSDYIDLQPAVQSMCEAVKSSISVLQINGFEEQIMSMSFLSDGFYGYEGKKVYDLRMAISQIGQMISVDNDETSSLRNYYEYLKDCLNKHIVIEDTFTLRQFLFYPFLIPWIKERIYNENDDFRLRQMDEIVEYVKSMSNFDMYQQMVLDSVVLSSNVSKRTVTLEIQNILNGESQWYSSEDIYDGQTYISSEVENIRRSLTDAFGENATIDDIVRGYSKNTYLYQFGEMYKEMQEKLYEQELGFQDQISALDVKYTDFRVVDDSITSYASIHSDLSSKDEILSFDNYDKLLIKQLRVPMNRIYIVDKTRGRYDKDLFGNEIVGIMPVIVTPANALFYQDVIRKNDSLLSDYNVIGKVRNSYRKYNLLQFDESVKPFDQTDTELSSYGNSETKEFVGLGEYLGSEVFEDGTGVTSNEFTVSENAAEQFPTMKFIGDRLDRQYLTSIGVVVFKVFKDSANQGKISFIPVESFVGSLDRTAKDDTTGERMFIDDIVNDGSDYINLFSNANIGAARDENPLGLKNAQIFKIANQTACSMGFFERDTRKHIHVTKSIYNPMLRIFERSEDKNTLDVDLIIDGGVSNIAQFIASTQLYERDHKTGEKTDKYVRDEFQRYGIFDFDDQSAHLFRLDNTRNCNVWRKVILRFDEFAKNTRKDLLFIADGPRPLCLEGTQPLIRRTKPQNTVKNSILPRVKMVSGLINSSYSAGYLNWFWSIDHHSGEYMWMPPSIKTIGVYLYTDNYGAYWDAPAGLNRGRINETSNLAFNPTNEEAGQIYINSWNYAVSYPLDGIFVEGQKTFQKDKTALDRVNVRRLMLGMEKVIRGFCKYFLYEGNTQFTRTRIKDTIDNYLEQVRANDGISEYMTVCDDRNNNEQTIENNELHITIAVRPIKSIEFIILNFIATNQSVDVAEVITSELGN